MTATLAQTKGGTEVAEQKSATTTTEFRVLRLNVGDKVLQRCLELQKRAYIKQN